jgi:hypothetical protein
MRTLAEQIGGKCKHFTGIMADGGKCNAGVVYLTIKSTDENRKGIAKYPCFRENIEVPCAKREFLTPEEVATEIAELESSWERMKLGLAATQTDAARLGLRKGNGGKGSVPCPACKTGTLHYTVAAYNGHMWGKCTTADCLSWMQ